MANPPWYLLARRAWGASRWFAAWQAADLEDLARGSEWRQHREGDAVYREGQAAELVLLVAGCVWTSLRTGLASTRFGALPAGSLLGLALLQGQSPAPEPWFECHATGPVKALAVPAHRVLRVLDSQPRLWREVAQASIACKRQRLQAVCRLQMGSVKERLLSALHQFAFQFSSGSSSAADLELVISQEELGRLIHQSRAHVNRALRDLAAEGLIELSYRRIRILDGRRLAAGAGMSAPAGP